ncbi:hypothetical protein BDW75DRAFT_153668 [Aspergillus navahoensis]
MSLSIDTRQLTLVKSRTRDAGPMLLTPTVQVGHDFAAASLFGPNLPRPLAAEEVQCIPQVAESAASCPFFYIYILFSFSGCCSFFWNSKGLTLREGANLAAQKQIDSIAHLDGPFQSQGELCRNLMCYFHLDRLSLHLNTIRAERSMHWRTLRIVRELLSLVGNIPWALLVNATASRAVEADGCVYMIEE